MVFCFAHIFLFSTNSIRTIRVCHIEPIKNYFRAPETGQLPIIHYQQKENWQLHCVEKAIKTYRAHGRK